MLVPPDRHGPVARTCICCSSRSPCCESARLATSHRPERYLEKLLHLLAVALLLAFVGVEAIDDVAAVGVVLPRFLGNRDSSSIRVVAGRVALAEHALGLGTGEPNP